MAYAGSSTTTYRMKLYCRHKDWLQHTKLLYGKVETFYYKLLLECTPLWDLGAQQILRELEKMTLPDRQGNLPCVEYPFGKTPVYFRRAAINGAIAMLHSYHSNLKTWKKQKEIAEKAGKVWFRSKPEPAKELHPSPVYYKGMYKEFSDHSIILKLYTGSAWCWIKCTLKGRELPKEGERQSPVLVIGRKNISLHVPVKLPVADVRTVKERMEASENVCGVTFCNTDTFAVCVIYSADGRAIASRFIRGGKEYVHHSKRLNEKVRANRKVMGNRFDWTGANRKYWKHLHHLGDYWSHKVSREIILFCSQYHAKVISIVKENGERKNTLDEDRKYQKAQIFWQKQIGKYTPFGLSHRIKRRLEYKAWQAGIVITGVRADYTSNKCTHCRSYLVKNATDDRLFRCEAGHSGNRDLNTAKNIAKMSLKKFGKQIA